jgi:hypothetical protein
MAVKSFPLYLRQMPVTSLQRLVNYVGIEDSAELLEYALPAQIRSLLDLSIWQAPSPDAPETVDIARFFRWVDTWLADGEDTLLERLADVSDDILVVMLSTMLKVRGWHDPINGAPAFVVGAYFLYAQTEAHWSLCEQLISVLLRHRQARLLALLRRCDEEQEKESSDSASSDASETDVRNAVVEDMNHERSLRMTRAGYVSALDAKAFLLGARSRTIAYLIAQTQYDPVARDYFQQQPQSLSDVDPVDPVDADGMASDASPAIAYEETATLGNPPKTANAIGLDEQSSAAQTGTHSVADPAFEFALLDNLLADIGALPKSAQPRLYVLKSPTRSDAAPALVLEAALSLLGQSDFDTMTTRWRELAYLSNVVMAAVHIGGRLPQEAQAASFTMATANLGLEYVQAQAGADRPTVSGAKDILQAIPGVVRLFQVGYHLLHIVPDQCAEALLRVRFPQIKTPARAAKRQASLQALAQRIAQREQEKAQSMIEDISFIDATTATALNVLTHTTPEFPLLLDSADGNAIYVKKGSRPISSISDLDKIAAFLETLADRLAQ